MSKENLIPAGQEYFYPLPAEAIEYKIEVNKRDYKYSLQQFRDILEKEMREFERQVIRCQVNIQSRKEQIAYIDKKIAKGET